MTAPIQLLVSENGRAPQRGACRRLGERFDVPVQEIPGTHLAHLDHPKLAGDRPFVRRASLSQRQ